MNESVNSWQGAASNQRAFPLQQLLGCFPRRANWKALEVGNRIRQKLMGSQRRESKEPEGRLLCVDAMLPRGAQELTPKEGPWSPSRALRGLPKPSLTGVGWDQVTGVRHHPHPPPPPPPLAAFFTFLLGEGVKGGVGTQMPPAELLPHCLSVP